MSASAAGPSPEDAAGGGLGVRGAVVRYGPTTAVDGVDLAVARGEVVALLGPSGCGKSSLLRAVAGLEPLASGTVTWDGVDLAGTPVHRRGFGLLFQDGQLFAHRDVAGNVGYGVPRGPARAARVAELLGLVGLPGTQRRAVDELSGGERQRVALARSLAPRPRLLLLDEPLSALDRELRERLAADLRRVLTTTGTTAVFVTHDQDEAFAVADRVAVMADGRLWQVAAPAVLWRAPASAQVARFLGYEAVVAVDDPAASVLLAGRPDRPAQGWVGLPPGALTVSPDGPLRGRVLGSHLRRGRVEVEVDLPGLGVLTADADAEPAAGSDVFLAVDVGALVVVAGPTAPSPR